MLHAMLQVVNMTEEIARLLRRLSVPVDAHTFGSEMGGVMQRVMW